MRHEGGYSEDSLHEALGRLRSSQNFCCRKEKSIMYHGNMKQKCREALEREGSMGMGVAVDGRKGRRESCNFDTGKMRGFTPKQK